MEEVKKISKVPFEKLSKTANCTFGGSEKPIAVVKPGETVKIETWDCFGGVVKPNQDLKKVLDEHLLLFANPITGPIYIEGAEPGDTLVVDIISIDVADIGITTVIPGFGALEGWLTLSPPITKFSEIRNGKIIFPTKNKKLEIPLNPFIGTIGVAPESEAITTVSPGPHGGNMDCPDIKPRNRLYLPVFRRGALFGVGDVHAIQGYGELCGTAVEVAAEVTLKFDLIKNKSINWPRIESSDEIMTVCSAKPLEDAARTAFMELLKWLEEDYGFERYDAYTLLSIAGNAFVAQIVDPLYTIVAKLPKKVIK